MQEGVQKRMVMNYSDEIELMNKILNFLFEKRDTHQALLYPESVGGKMSISAPVAERALMQLCDDKLAVSVQRDYTMAGNKDAFGISHNGVKLILSLLDEYKDNPYGEFLRGIEDAKKQDQKLKHQQLELTQSSINLNASNKILIDKTEKYYSQLQWATWIIAGATIVNVLVSSCH